MTSATVLAHKDIFGTFFEEIAREAASDPEPTPRFSSAWDSWQRRHWQREHLRAELVEAETLTTNGGDPCPLSSEGLIPFLNWARRQEARRSARRPARRRW